MPEEALPLPDPAAENSAGTAQIGTPFKAGQSGNPGGRPRGLARKVREVLGDDDGETLARFWAACLTGVLTTYETVTDADGKTSTRAVTTIVDVKDRLAASKLLSERGWGKPPQFAPIEDEDPLDLSERRSAEVAASLDARMDELAERRRAKDEADAARERPDEAAPDA